MRGGLCVLAHWSEQQQQEPRGCNTATPHAARHSCKCCPRRCTSGATPAYFDRAAWCPLQQPASEVFLLARAGTRQRWRRRAASAARSAAGKRGEGADASTSALHALDAALLQPVDARAVDRIVRRAVAPLVELVPRPLPVGLARRGWRQGGGGGSRAAAWMATRRVRSLLLDPPMCTLSQRQRPPTAHHYEFHAVGLDDGHLAVGPGRELHTGRRRPPCQAGGGR